MSSVLSEPVGIEPVRLESEQVVQTNEPVPRWLRRAGSVVALATLGPVLLGFLGFFLGILFLPLITLVALLFAAGGPSLKAEHAFHRRGAAPPRRSGRPRALHPARHAHV